jgi:hypothetical protein
VASITRQRQGKYTYLYESRSYRDEQGRPRNHKTKIGTLDQKTGKPRYTAEYLERMRQAGTPLRVSVFDGIDGFEQRMREALDSVRNYGLFYFLKHLAEKTGLLAVIQETIPAYWSELCVLSFYLLAGDKPLMYLDLWLDENEHFPVGNMDSRRTSELLLAFGQKERNDFYRAWISKNVSGDYLALDITSLSSYSKLIPDCEWGHNRDGEALAQINMCLLFGEGSQLPVYQTLYSGSLADSATFRTTIEEMKGASGGKRLVLVMDKGFYSEKNLKMLIQEGHRFLIAVPFTLSAAKELVEGERGSIDKAANIIKTSSQPMRGVSRTIHLEGMALRAHVLYNPEREVAERNRLYSHTAWLKEQVLAGKKPGGFEKDIKKYLAVSQRDSKVEVRIRQEAVDRELSTSGWVVIVGNERLAAQEAHDIYRKKDVVEKAFMRYKNNLGMSRLRIHDGERMRNKALVAFISLALVSEIHKVMKAKDLYKRMTMDKLLMTLSKLKLLVIDGHHILRPVTKEQREIFSAFGLPPPVVG